MRRLALPLLLLVTATPAGDDRPDRRADPDLQIRINDAIAKGIDYLKSIQKPDGSWPYAPNPGVEDMTAGSTALALYALSASRVLPDDPAIRKGLKWTEQRKTGFTSAGMYSTYSASLLVLALTRIDPKEHRTRIHRLAESIIDGQLGNDMWSYRIAGAKTKERDEEEEGPVRPQAGDNSNSQFAVLAIWAASALAGFPVPDATWQRVQGFYARTQVADGSWGYAPRSMNGTGSMTSAGLCSYVYATAGLLGGVPGLPAARKSPAAQRGMEALLRGLTPGDYGNYYFAYALERAGTVMAIPEERWYHEGARILVQQQEAGGRWGEGAYETSLALLFLSRATRAAITQGGDERGGRRITEFPVRVGPGQLEEALLYYATAPAKERKALAHRFSEARAAAVGFLVGKLRASDRDLRVAAHELLDALVEKRFLFDPDGTPEDRDVMLGPIEAFWKEHGPRLVWDEAKGRFVSG